MSSSVVLTDNFMVFNPSLCSSIHRKSSNFLPSFRVRGDFGGRNQRVLGLVVPNAKKKKGLNSRKKSWWQRFFFEEDGNWLGLREEDLEEFEEESKIEVEGSDKGERDSEKEKFEAWKNRAEALIEGLVKTLENFVLGKEDDDLLYEDHAKFLAVLIIVPWAMDFLVHDYVLMPFLDRYVKTVPLAAELLDVRRSQKLEMVKELNSEKARLRFEVEIGKAPPLSEEETWWELRHKALELRDEWRLNNRNAFANIWSDMVFGVSVFLLLYFNQSKVALLKFTGYKIINNISDAGKAFLIILITDIFLGYHSESGWQTVCEVFVEHYGLEVDQSTITIFICLVPVIMDACVKLWLFKFLPRLSPKVFNIFHEMKRH
uniref:Chloroplast envelope membrane protein n=1 Tax=Chenopodium quinoa TaxID=63459 RepID=A0A803KT66_CHEQI